MPPIEKRDVPSGITPWPWVARIAVQRLVLRDRQDWHCAAFRRVERDDVVALLQRRDARPDVDDDAGAFVAEDRREQALRIGAGKGEVVGVADAGGLDLDQDLAGLRAFELNGHRSRAACPPPRRLRRERPWRIVSRLML